jgi:hypothetical protein
MDGAVLEVPKYPAFEWISGACWIFWKGNESEMLVADEVGDWLGLLHPLPGQDCVPDEAVELEELVLPDGTMELR